MKFMMILKKIRQYLPYVLWFVGLWAGLIFVPQFWFGHLEYNHFFFNTYAYICLVVLPLYYYSFLRYMAIYHKPVREKFLQEMPSKSIGNHLKFLAKQLHFWLGYAGIALLFCTYPLTTTSPTVAYLLGAYGSVKKTLPIFEVNPKV